MVFRPPGATTTPRHNIGSYLGQHATPSLGLRRLVWAIWAPSSRPSFLIHQVLAQLLPCSHLFSEGLLSPSQLSLRGPWKGDPAVSGAANVKTRKTPQFIQVLSRIYIYIYTYVYTYLHACAHAYVYINTNVYISASVYVYRSIICIDVSVSICVYTYIYIHIYICIYIFVHICIHMCLCL